MSLWKPIDIINWVKNFSKKGFGALVGFRVQSTQLSLNQLQIYKYKRKVTKRKRENGRDIIFQDMNILNFLKIAHIMYFQ